MLTGIGLKVSTAFTGAERMTHSSDNLSRDESCQAVPGSRMIAAFPGSVRKKRDNVKGWEGQTNPVFFIGVTATEATVSHMKLSTDTG